MRLIDADNISFHCNYDGDCTGDIEDCKECENYICDFRDIQEQQTAYDIDKVVEELDKASDYYECEEQGREHVQMVDLTKQSKSSSRWWNR